MILDEKLNRIYTMKLCVKVSVHDLPFSLMNTAARVLGKCRSRLSIKVTSEKYLCRLLHLSFHEYSVFQ